jgi:hypothetical protein
MNVQWQRNTSDNVNRTATRHRIDRPGVHTLKFWMVDPIVVPQLLVIDTGGLRPSLLGPPSSLRLSWYAQSQLPPAGRSPPPAGGVRDRAWSLGIG